jgi:hypothetical protein
MKTTWKDNPRKGWEASLKMYYPQKPIPLLRKSVSNFYRSLKQRAMTFQRDHFGWSEQKRARAKPARRLLFLQNGDGKGLAGPHSWEVSRAI